VQKPVAVNSKGVENVKLVWRSIKFYLKLILAGSIMEVIIWGWAKYHGEQLPQWGSLLAFLIGIIFYTAKSDENIR
jgi:hypothetical protein